MTWVTFVHIFTGAIAVFIGFSVIVLSKGSRIHKVAGSLFLYSMLAMAASGAVIAFEKSQWLSFLVAFLTAYLVFSAQQTMSSSTVKRSLRFYASSLFGLFAVLIGIQVATTPALANASPVTANNIEAVYLFAGIAALALVSDGVYATKANPSQRYRLARHLWRMSFALFIATASMFTGPGTVLFPEFVRASGLIALPELIVIAFMCVWLMNVSFSHNKLQLWSIKSGSKKFSKSAT